MYKCAIFDFDGTLVQSNEIKKETFYEVTQNFSELSSILDKILSNPDSGDRYKIFDTLIKSSDIDKKFGINTKESMQIGTSNGIISEVNRFINNLKKDYPDLNVIITGGDSMFLLNKIKNAIFADQDFLAIGLNNIIKLNND